MPVDSQGLGYAHPGEGFRTLQPLPNLVPPPTSPSALKPHHAEAGGSSSTQSTPTARRARSVSFAEEPHPQRSHLAGRSQRRRRSSSRSSLHGRDSGWQLAEGEGRASSRGRAATVGGPHGTHWVSTQEQVLQHEVGGAQECMRMGRQRSQEEEGGFAWEVEGPSGVVGGALRAEEQALSESNGEVGVSKAVAQLLHCRYPPALASTLQQVGCRARPCKLPLCAKCLCP